jgi:hypothetical protein
MLSRREPCRLLYTTCKRCLEIHSVCTVAHDERPGVKFSRGKSRTRTRSRDQKDDVLQPHRQHPFPSPEDTVRLLWPQTPSTDCCSRTRDRTRPCTVSSIVTLWTLPRNPENQRRESAHGTRPWSQGTRRPLHRGTSVRVQGPIAIGH